MRKFSKVIFFVIMFVFFGLIISGCDYIEPETNITISFDSNGGSEIAPIKTAGNLEIDIPVPTKEGYEFIGWFWDNETFERAFTENSLITKPTRKNITVYAKWYETIQEEEPQPTYTLTFNTNGGKEIEPIIESILETSPFTTKDFNAFIGWYTNEDLDESTLATFPLELNGDITLYAKWEPIIASEGLQYALRTISNTYSITGYTGTATSIVVPSVHNEIEVSTIDANVFEHNSIITSIFIPDSIIEIGAAAFNECSSLKKVIMSKNLQSIGASAFKNCATLENLALPETMIDIGSEAFFNCVELKEINISASVTSLGENIIRGCNNLQKLTMPSDRTLMSLTGNKVAYIPTSVKTVVINSKSNVLINSIFENCIMIEEIQLPNNITSIGSSAFYYCNKINSITIPSSVTSIGQYAFYDVKGTIIFEEESQLSAIEEKTFANYKGPSITIPGRVTNIGKYAFDNATSEIIFAADSEFTTIEPYTFADFQGSSITLSSSLKNIGYYAFSKSFLTSITIPEGAISIGYQAFFDCRSLASITIPSSVISIGHEVFNGTPWLRNQPDGVVYAGKVAYEYKGILEQNATIVLSPDTIAIASNAFAGRMFSNINLPNSLTNIGPGAFQNCTNITSITIPRSVNSIGQFTFRFVAATIYFEDESELTTIGRNVFQEYQGTSLTIPSSITTIEDGAFIRSINLTDFTIPSLVTSIGDYAFYNCDSLTSIDIPDSVNTIGENAFKNTQWFYNQPSGMVYAGRVIYKHIGVMPSDTAIELLPDTKGIADYAFAEHENLTSIIIPSSITSIGLNAFNNCINLEAIEVAEENEYYKSIDGVLFDKSGTILIQYPIGNSRPSYTIPSSVTNIGEYAFANATAEIEFPAQSLTTIEANAFRDYKGNGITIPSSVTNIGEYAFANMTGTIDFEIGTIINNIGENAFGDYKGTEITIPSGITSIGNNAFRRCNNLENLIFENDSQLTIIGKYAFDGCKSLINITIPKSVTSIGYGAFYDCNNLVLLTFEDNSILASISENAFYRCSSLTTITIPDGVRSIGQYAFYECTSLTSIEIPNSVKSIGSSMLRGCTSLTTLTAPFGINANTLVHYFGFNGIPISLKTVNIAEGVIMVRGSAFSDCSYLTNITIPESVMIIAGGAFQNCTSLTSITIPKNVISINPYAFANLTCEIEFAQGSKITSIGWDAFREYKGTSITIPDGVISIEIDAFVGCNNLANITFPDSLTTLSSSTFNDTAWYNSQPDGIVYAGLIAYNYKRSTFNPNISLLEGTKAIAHQAFQDCACLLSITIPSSVTTIGYSAFNNCANLTSITIENSIPPFLSSYAFSYTPNDLKIYVPAASLDTYKTAEGWSDYSDQIYAITA